MKLYILLLLVVCWVYAAPNHRSHTNLQKIGVNNNKKRPFSIVGSKTSSIKKHPYTAAVLTSSNELLGGGAICDKKWIVTAGWNTYGQTVSSLQVRLGSDNALKGGQVLKLKKMIPHPNYTAEDWDYDVGMLEVDGEIKFNGKAKKIKLTKKPPKNKSSGVVTGWGSRTYLSENADSDKLQELSITMYDRNTCIKKWWDNDSVNPRSYCAYKEDCGPCSYDFGDPLVQKNKLVGMYLGGYGCAMNSYPGLYSDVSRFYKWIVDTMKKNSDPVELVDNDKNYYGEENDDEDDSEEEDEDEEDEEEEEEEEEEEGEDGVSGDRDEENDDAIIGEDDAIGVA